MSRAAIMSQRSKLSIALAGSLVVLAACGGGGRDDDAAAVEPTSVPDAALASPQSFSSWVGAREASESREPLAMNPTMPPTSETAEPIELD